MPKNPVNPIYVTATGNVPGYSGIFHQSDANGSFSRSIRVSGSLNNPLTLTGSFASNAGFMVMNTASVFITASNGQGYIGVDFHMSGQNHQIYPIQLSRVSASDGGDITVLYY
jgi:hypothetical protein